MSLKTILQERRARRRQEKLDARAVEDWADEQFDKQRLARKNNRKSKSPQRGDTRFSRFTVKQRALFLLALPLGFLALQGNSCFIIGYDVFGQPNKWEHVFFSHIDDNCGPPSAWDKVLSLADAHYNHCFETYWWKHTIYERDFRYPNNMRRTEEWYNPRECGALTHTWRDQPTRA